MFTVNETPDAAVFKRAQERGQRTWTLVEQDQTAVPTMAHWIYLNILTAPPNKLRQVLEECLRMREFPNKKAAD